MQPPEQKKIKFIILWSDFQCGWGNSSFSEVKVILVKMRKYALFCKMLTICSFIIIIYLF